MSSADDRPNVLLIVADDLGYTDLGSFGGEISTPNLDALAFTGARLTNFYTTPTCSPTRAMLMTGADNHLVGLGNMAEAITPNQKGKPGYEGYLNNKAITLPTVFAGAGYRTVMVGKWHLGFGIHGPDQHGFQQSFALHEGGAGHLSDMHIIAPNGATYTENGKRASLPSDFYSTRFYSNKLIDYLAAGEQSGKPFFAYLAFTAPHWPLQAPDASIARYFGKYDEGYDVLHERRIAAAKDRGVVPENSPVSIPRDHGQPAWQDLSPEQKKVEARRMEIYAAMVEDMDTHLGRVFEYLESSGQMDNTVVLFLSDNGAEGGNTDRLLEVFSRKVEQCCDNSLENMGRATSYLFAGPNWARASTGPFAGFKGYTTEGGIRSPAIIRYPGQSNSDGIIPTLATAADVMPTLLELAGMELPEGGEVAPSGRSIFAGGASRAVSWELFGNRAVRKGPWKLVKLAPRFGATQWRLYNLDSDPSEQVDVADSHPEVLLQLIESWRVYAEDNGIVPAEGSALLH